MLWTGKAQVSPVKSTHISLWNLSELHAHFLDKEARLRDSGGSPCRELASFRPVYPRCGLGDDSILSEGAASLFYVDELVRGPWMETDVAMQPGSRLSLSLLP